MFAGICLERGCGIRNPFCRGKMKLICWSAMMHFPFSHKHFMSAQVALLSALCKPLSAQLSPTQAEIAVVKKAGDPWEVLACLVGQVCLQGSINKVQTRCIVEGEAEKVYFSTVFSW